MLGAMENSQGDLFPAVTTVTAVTNAGNPINAGIAEGETCNRQAERLRLHAVTGAAENTEAVILPVPDDAPDIPKKLLSAKVDGTVCTVNSQWDYRDALGRMLFSVLRIDSGNGHKEFRPLALWRTDKGMQWKHKAPPAPRPLYGLDRLAARPDADVIVCEGEKAADAAGRLFPDLVAISSMGGAKSPDKSDWGATAGRALYLWGDNDQAGKDYIEAVEKLATAAGAAVAGIINLEWFSRMAGRPGIDRADLDLPLPQGWDAADAELEGFTAENIKAFQSEEGIDGRVMLFVKTMAKIPATADGNPEIEAAEKRTQAKELFKDSDFAVIEYRKGFRNGVYWQEPFTDDDMPKHPIWICSPLIVVAETRDTGQSNWGRLLTWQDNDGHSHTWACPSELLVASDTAEFRRELARNGLAIASNSKARQKLVDYVLTHNPLTPERARCVSKTGWHEGRYVLPDRVMGAHSGESVVYQGDTSSDFSSHGDVDAWQREVAALAAGNSRMVFAISCAFAGVLVEMSHESGGGFQFTGTTSKGKTSILIDPAASVWGHPDRFAKKWRTTSNGLEALCLSRNHSTLILDDLGQADAKECGHAAYLIANGQGKARMQREGGNRPLTTWRTLLLSSGEVDLAQHMAEAGKTAKGGQSARLPSIPADAGTGLGVIEILHGHAGGKQFSEAMKAATRKYHGAAGSAFLEKLTEPETLKEITDTIRDGIAATVEMMGIPANSPPEIGRVASRFALVAFAGELATRFSVTGWAAGESTRAALRCFNDWSAESGGAMGADDRSLLSQVSAFMQAHGASRFPPHDIGEVELRRVLNRAGFSHAEGDSTAYWVESGAFKRELCKGFNPTAAAKSLIMAGWMLPGNGKSHPYQQQKRVPSLSKNGIRFYVLTGAAIEGDI